MENRSAAQRPRWGRAAGNDSHMISACDHARLGKTPAYGRWIRMSCQRDAAVLPSGSASAKRRWVAWRASIGTVPLSQKGTSQALSLAARTTTRKLSRRISARTRYSLPDSIGPLSQ
jgi:hypothetical protein